MEAFKARLPTPCVLQNEGTSTCTLKDAYKPYWLVSPYFRLQKTFSEALPLSCYHQMATYDKT